MQKMMYQNFDEKVEHLYQLKERMAEGLSKIDDVVINGMPVREGAPHILSVSFLGIRSEVLLHTLEDRNIYEISLYLREAHAPAIRENQAQHFPQWE